MQVFAYADHCFNMQVFAFVKSNQFGNSPHKAECHVCECLLEFRTKVEVNFVKLYLFSCCKKIFF